MSSSSRWDDLAPPSAPLGWSCAIALEEFFSRIWASIAPLFWEFDAFLFWGSCFPALPLADAFRLTPSELLALLCCPAAALFAAAFPSWCSWPKNSSSSRLLLFSFPYLTYVPPSMRHSVSNILEVGPAVSLLVFFYLEGSEVRIWFLEAGLSFLCPTALLLNSAPESAEFLCCCKIFLSNCGGSAAWESESIASWLFFRPSPACVIDCEWWWLAFPPERAYPSLYFPSDFCFENFRASLSIEWESVWFYEFYEFL